MESVVNSFVDFMMTACAGMVAAWGIFFWLFIALFAMLWTFFIRIFIAYRMAKNRRRDPLGWVLLSFLFSPLLTWIILLIVGDSRS